MLVRGFDLFFSNASDETIESIARQLGGNYDFDFIEERVTHMFGRELLLPIDKIGEIHVAADNVGKMFEAHYNCKYESSEFYLKVSENSVIFK